MSRIASPGGVRQREPRVRDKPYLGWIARLPCIACAVIARRTWPVEVAHIKCGFPEAGWRAFGSSEKSHDRFTAGICDFHHRLGPDAQHQNRGGSERDWWQRRNVYPPTFCGALREAYERGEDGLRQIRQAALGEFPWPD